MKALLNLLSQHQQFLLYCVCGGSGVLCHAGLYYVLLEMGTEYTLANGIGYASGTLLSFALNRVITFDMRDQTARRLLFFVATAGLGFLASHGLLLLLVEGLQIPKLFALLPVIPAVVILQFALNKRFAFQQTKLDEPRLPS